ncbi:C40 family peptidase [Arthrobacter rhombi]|uniref:C40 family peptidase n=1 Tax=Micrococcaceae TaxID=1268 RepID=UPI000BB80D38|nr:C40 family peptidase [Glutamicibacter sp. BW78]PCC26428.1 hypothetical protein CIK75_03185 [Glutamicibacter sp. BW78]
MTTRHALGRHRATPVRTNPLESISKAVSSNAGSVGRQAAVIAAASGLVLSIGVPAQATPATREADKAPASDVLQADLAAKTTSVQAPATVKVKLAKTEAKKAEKSMSVSGVKSATDGADFRAAQKAEQEAADKAAAERREAAEQAAAERQEAAQEAAADRREAAANRQTATASNSSSSSSNDGADGAAMTRESRSGNTSNTTTTASTPKKAETKTVASTGNSSIAAMAASYKGAPYVWGGTSPGGWDCSGFVQYIYGKAGISLPHNTTAIRTSGKFAKTSNPKPGDLVYQNGGSHVGIYIGGGKIVGAQNPKVGTVERPADSPYGPLMGYYTYVG